MIAHYCYGCVHRADVACNKSIRLHSFLCGALGVFLPLLFILSFIVSTLSKEQLEELLGEGATRTITIFTVSALNEYQFHNVSLITSLVT